PTKRSDSMAKRKRLSSTTEPPRHQVHSRPTGDAQGGTLPSLDVSGAAEGELYGGRWRTDHSYRTDIDTIACLAQSRVCMVVVRIFAQRGDRSQLGWRARVRPWASGKLSNDFMVLHGDVLLVDDVKRLGH